MGPDYAWAHHVLGRWHDEVAPLSSTSRSLVRPLYGSRHPTSFPEGVRHLRRATELQPEDLDHWPGLGFARAAAGLSSKAQVSWTPGLAMPSRDKHDAVATDRAQSALRKLMRD